MEFVRYLLWNLLTHKFFNSSSSSMTLFRSFSTSKGFFFFFFFLAQVIKLWESKIGVITLPDSINWWTREQFTRKIYTNVDFVYSCITDCDLRSETKLIEAAYWLQIYNNCISFAYKLFIFIYYFNYFTLRINYLHFTESSYVCD